MKTRELAQKDDKALNKLLIETKSKLVKDRFKIASKEMTNVSEIKKSRKLIAKIETIVRERTIAEAEKAMVQEDKKSGVK